MHTWRTAIADNSEGAGELAGGSRARWVAGASRAGRGQIAGGSRSDDDKKNDNNDNPNLKTARSYMDRRERGGTEWGKGGRSEWARGGG
eukprot:9500027-Pyramimonas_sp.AAC.1